MELTLKLDPAQDAGAALTEPLYSLVVQAIAEKATDIHFDPVERGKLVRFRVDGALHAKEIVPLDQRGKVLSQLKVLADFSIDKTFTPQEGHITVRTPQGQFDIRVSIVPVGRREAIHLRINSGAWRVHDLAEMGMSQEDREKVLDTLRNPAGLVLVAGAAGSGRSTTLYSLAEALDLRNLAVASIEDPVEYQIPFVRQVQVNEFQGLTMATGLRVLLRMDPDAILISEIRDEASAVSASRAALAGRLVLATIHAPDAASAIAAMRAYGVPDYVLGGALRMVIRQELLRRVCRACVNSVPITDEQQRAFGQHGLMPPERVLKAVGCLKCNGYGHSGRIGVYEVTSIAGALGQAIAAGMNGAELGSSLQAAVRRSLAADALEKVTAEVVSYDEAAQLWARS